MPSIRKGLLQLVFSGSFMKRWNDKLRPMELVEMDKQGHKMIVAWALGELYGQGLPQEERLGLREDIVRGGIFDYLYRLVITDIKPPVFYQIKANPDHYGRLTDWVLEQLRPRVQPLGREFWDALCLHYHRQARGEETPADAVLAAAHLFASRWEFQLIRPLNPWDDEMVEIEANFQHGLAQRAYLPGVGDLLHGPATALGRFVTLCGTLRFQKRWSQTPRIPETSVLGHMFLVACLAYFLSIAVGACSARRCNDFFAGLFHDVPELLTRDIISPVKGSVKGIDDLIREYEKRELERRLFAILDTPSTQPLAQRLRYLLGIDVGSEFCDMVCLHGRPACTNWEQLQGEFNDDAYDPKDGWMLKICDQLAAFLEAYTSKVQGVVNEHLQQALWRIRDRYAHVALTEEVHIGALLADFD
jgi:putative hydrolase of HD superfamily